MNKETYVYFAGPQVFSNDCDSYFKEMTGYCRELSITPIFPVDSECKTSVDIYNSNIRKITHSNYVLASLEPFMGISLDVGTAFEVGYAKSLNKKVIGFYDEELPKVYADRARSAVGESFNFKKYPKIEDFGLLDNLMIVHGCDKIFEQALEALKWIRKDANNG